MRSTTYTIRLPAELGDKLRDFGLLRVEPLAFLLSDAVARQGNVAKPLVKEYAEAMVDHHGKMQAIYLRLRWAAMSDDERRAEDGPP